MAPTAVPHQQSKLVGTVILMRVLRLQPAKAEGSTNFCCTYAMRHVGGVLQVSRYRPAGLATPMRGVEVDGWPAGGPAVPPLLPMGVAEPSGFNRTRPM